ncbi:hypothetical protein RRG08_025831 [Elysia crispata]|uniref:Endonuclease/exonuclease/phosphatase domain-containing protein n=1 Tax=Elysia crispata TaxID=231223 RepID=A0AAE0Y406_9GAST|nr:hypothetical protein RRG08_025831 [Elysia crispata]
MQQSMKPMYSGSPRTDVDTYGTWTNQYVPLVRRLNTKTVTHQAHNTSRRGYCPEGAHPMLLVPWIPPEEGRVKLLVKIKSRFHTEMPMGWHPVGNFNGHSPSWGYQTIDKKGDGIEDWMIEHQLTLINELDDPPTLTSLSLRTTSSPDLAMATDNIHKITTRDIHNNQHCNTAKRKLQNGKLFSGKQAANELVKFYMKTWGKISIANAMNSKVRAKIKEEYKKARNSAVMQDEISHHELSRIPQIMLHEESKKVNKSEQALNSFKFRVGDPCYGKVFSTNSEKSPKWVPAVTTKVLGTRSCNFKVSGPTWRQYIEQLQP